MEDSTKMDVTIIGGGLVGSLAACFFSRRGHQVHVHEMREDLRVAKHARGRSINLALSERGRSALRALGLEERVLSTAAIPMYGRMIHDRDGRRRVVPYGRPDQCIYSVGRRYLNELLLDECSNRENVTLTFNERLVKCDLTGDQVSVTLESRQSPGDRGEVNTRKTDLIVGCDGAYSAVRGHLARKTRLNFSQQYIDHGYIELSIPPLDLTGIDDGQNGVGTSDVEGQQGAKYDPHRFRMEVNYLHIWPRDDFMMIALPNFDGSFTVTLFMQFDRFEAIQTPQDLIDFFTATFTDSIELIGKDQLIKDFFGVKPSPLVSVKCDPYHYEDKCVIMGDAAHAMVPFFGQGMNCGMEDALVLDELLGVQGEQSLRSVLAEFTAIRRPNCHEICDLAMANYIEMRHLVNSRSFLARKWLDSVLNRMFPRHWVPLYSMVTFSRTPYAECTQRRKKQDRLIGRTVSTFGYGLAGLVAATAYQYAYGKGFIYFDFKSMNKMEIEGVCLKICR